MMSQKLTLLTLPTDIQYLILNEVNSLPAIHNFGSASRSCRKQAAWFIFRSVTLTDKAWHKDRNEWLIQHLVDPEDDLVTANVRTVTIDLEKGTYLTETPTPDGSSCKVRDLSSVVGKELKGEVADSSVLKQIFKNVKNLQRLK
jgi:hypothetical protein